LFHCEHVADSGSAQSVRSWNSLEAEKMQWEMKLTKYLRRKTAEFLTYSPEKNDIFQLTFEPQGLVSLYTHRNGSQPYRAQCAFANIRR
jgi:hypothetical protein